AGVAPEELDREGAFRGVASQKALASTAGAEQAGGADQLGRRQRSSELAGENPEGALADARHRRQDEGVAQPVPTDEDRRLRRKQATVGVVRADRLMVHDPARAGAASTGAAAPARDRRNSRYTSGGWPLSSLPSRIAS